MTKKPPASSGLHEIIRGGLPRGRATLVEGGPGSGKMVLTLQPLVNGASRCQVPGIFVAFEENSRRILANTVSFGWDLAALLQALPRGVLTRWAAL